MAPAHAEPVSVATTDVGTLARDQDQHLDLDETVARAGRTWSNWWSGPVPRHLLTGVDADPAHLRDCFRAVMLPSLGVPSVDPDRTSFTLLVGSEASV